MWDQIRLFLQAVVTVFAIIDVIGGLPVFVSLTAGFSPVRRRKTFSLAWLIALIMVLAIGLGGKYLLELFMIRLEALMFAGGLLLVVVGISSLLRQDGHSSQDAKSARDGWLQLAVSPIACPLLAGPGAFVTVMLLVQNNGWLMAILATLTAFALVLLILSFSNVIFRLLGRVGTLAVGRVMELFIVAIGVNFCFDAIIKLFGPFDG